MNEGKGKIFRFPGTKREPSPIEATHQAEVVSFPKAPVEREAVVQKEIDPIKLLALSNKVSYVSKNYPFLMTTPKLEEATAIVEKMTPMEVLQHINAVDVDDLSDTDAPLFRALVIRVRQGYVSK